MKIKKRNENFLDANRVKMVDYLTGQLYNQLIDGIRLKTRERDEKRQQKNKNLNTLVQFCTEFAMSSENRSQMAKDIGRQQKREE